MERRTIIFPGLAAVVTITVLWRKKTPRSLNDYTSVPVVICYVTSALAGQLMYEKGFFMITFAWVAVVVMTGIMRWKNGSSI